MTRRRDTKVLVVGAGPVGLFTALTLADAGVKPEIVDEEWRTAAHSYALGLHPRTLELLAELSLAEELSGRGSRIDTVAFYEGEDRKAELDLGVLDSPYPYLLVLPQSVFEGALERSLVERGVRVRWNHSVSRIAAVKGQLEASIEELGKASTGYAAATTEWSVERATEIAADLVVGADGARSRVREFLGTPFEEVRPPADFAVFEFVAEFEGPPEVRVVLTEDTTNVLWPLPGGRCRFSFELPTPVVPPEERTKSRLSVQIGKRSFPHLTEERLLALIAERAPWFTAGIRELKWALQVRFEHRLADSLGRDNVWLAGDAAHLTGPVGIHSMNSGLREGHRMGRLLAGIVRRKASRLDLEEVAAETRREWAALLGVSGGPEVAADADPWVRDHAARIVDCIPSLGAHLRTLAKTLGITV